MYLYEGPYGLFCIWGILKGSLGGAGLGRGSENFVVI